MKEPVLPKVPRGSYHVLCYVSASLLLEIGGDTCSRRQVVLREVSEGVGRFDAIRYRDAVR